MRRKILIALVILAGAGIQLYAELTVRAGQNFIARESN